jgi:hypothetical protein
MDPYPIEVNVAYPERQSRLIMLFRLLLLIPAEFVLYFIAIVASIIMILGWFAVIVTGRYPRGLHGFLAGYLRWNTRVTGYAMGLTDKYRPFRLEP